MTLFLPRFLGFFWVKNNNASQTNLKILFFFWVSFKKFLKIPISFYSSMSKLLVNYQQSPNILVFSGLLGIYWLKLFSNTGFTSICLTFLGKNSKLGANSKIRGPLGTLIWFWRNVKHRRLCSQLCTLENIQIYFYFIRLHFVNKKWVQLGHSLILLW